MKNLFATIFIFLFTTINAQEIITNESIIQMKDLGFDESIIISKIESSDVNFDSSIDALTKLKKSGLSPSVISLVMEKSKYNTKSKTGIYFLSDKKLKPILPSVFSGSNTNAVAQKLVSGLINSKEKSQLPKVQSNNVINTRSPEFTFIFDPETEADNMQNYQGQNPNIFNWWFRVATSPNEFVLVKMRVKKSKNLREVITAKNSAFTSSNGIDPKLSIPFSIDVIGNNKYKVTPDNLEPGEYCFIYQGNVPNGRTNQSVFDFSIR
jgi:hypothetical protein